MYESHRFLGFTKLIISNTIIKYSYIYNILNYTLMINNNGQLHDFYTNTLLPIFNNNCKRSLKQLYLKPGL